MKLSLLSYFTNSLLIYITLAYWLKSLDYLTDANQSTTVFCLMINGFGIAILLLRKLKPSAQLQNEIGEWSSLE